MSDQSRKIDASRRRVLTAGTSLAVLGAAGLERTVQEAQAQTPAMEKVNASMKAR